MLRSARSLARTGVVHCPCGCTGRQRSRTLRAREKNAWKKEAS